jgi:hypothetical protein
MALVALRFAIYSHNVGAMTNQIFVSIHLTLQSLISQVTDGI